MGLNDFSAFLFFWIDANSSDGEIDSNGSSSPCSKRQRTDDNFDACDFVRESVTDEAVDQMSMGATDDDYEFATHGNLFRQKFWFKLRLAILILTEFFLLKQSSRWKGRAKSSMWQAFGKWKVVLLVYHPPTAAKNNLILVEWILSKRKYIPHIF